MDWDTLTAAQRRTYQEAVTQTHHRRVEIAIQRLDGTTIHTFSTRITGGQWDVDTKSTPESTLSDVEIFDPDWSLDWKNGAHRRFQVQATDSRFIPAFDDWVEVDLFTGPIHTFTRQGPVATLTCRGSKQKAMGSVRDTFSRPRKAKATAVIDELLALAGVPKRFRRVPNLKVRLPNAVTVRIKERFDGKDKDKKKDDVRLSKRRRVKITHEDTYLGKAEEIAEAIDRVLLEDGRGRFIVRRHPSKPVVTLTDRHLVEPVEWSDVGADELRNVFILIGKKPKGRKKRVRAVARFPDWHNLSAESLAPWAGDKDYELIRVTVNDQVGTHKRAKQIVKRQRDRAMRDVVRYAIAIVPVAPYLRPRDVARAQTGGGTVRVRAGEMSFPLAPGGGEQTIGALRRAKVKRASGRLTWAPGRMLR